MTKLDGGTGTDTLTFHGQPGQGSTELTLTHGGATNFENLDGSGSDDIIRGDTGANVLEGEGGADTIYGGSGNDALIGWSQGSVTSASSFDDGEVRNQANWSNYAGNDNLYGEAGDDLLVGSYGDNILDGGTGADTIYSGGGSDTIVLRVGDGGSTLAAADTITDFTDGTDKLGMDDNLLFSELTIAQGTYSNSNDTIISKGSEYLAILTGIDASVLSEADFTPVDIA